MSSVTAASTDALVAARDLRKAYPGTQALAGVSITVRPHEIVGVVGENGTGKSTLLKILAGIQAPDSGELWLRGRQVTLRSVRAGVITGILLAVTRISGETAPLLFTSLNNQFWTTDLNAPMSNLPVVIFQFAMSPYKDWQELAWAGSLFITLAVLILNILARVFFRQSAPK